MENNNILKAKIRIGLWGLVLVAMILISFYGDVINTWGDNSKKTILLFVLFVAFVGDVILNAISRKKSNDEVTIDEKINRKANYTSSIITILYVIVYVIIIYSRYEIEGFIPVVFFWMLAYSVIAVLNFSSSILTIFYFSKLENKHNERL